MRFRLPLKTLTETVAIVSKAVAAKGVKPILANLLITAQNNQLRFVGTDLEVMMISTIEAEIEDNGNFTIPADYVFDGLPENVSIATADRGIIFTRNVTAEGNLLNIRINVEFKRTFYPVTDYADFREFHKKMFDKLNEQVVIKKKANP